MSEIPPKYLDKRTQARYLARGVLTEKDLEKHLKALPDRNEEALPVEVQQPESDRTPSR